MNENEKLSEEAAVELSEAEIKDVEAHVAQRTPVIFEIIRISGEEELNRPSFSLWFSGFAAGISMGFSVLAQACIKSVLPDAPWALLVEKLGYTTGFLIVILAHQQLFTENTLTAVVPLMAHPHKQNCLRVARLWSIVLTANVIGTAAFSAFILFAGAVSPEIHSAIHEIAQHALNFAPTGLFARAIGAGFIIATLVWILANIENSKLAVIIFLTYLVALCDFAHIVAGSVEALYLAMEGAVTIRAAVFDFFIPTLMGNVVGGTALFAMVAYGQIQKELKTSTGEN